MDPSTWYDDMCMKDGSCRITETAYLQELLRDIQWYREEQILTPYVEEIHKVTSVPKQVIVRVIQTLQEKDNNSGRFEVKGDKSNKRPKRNDDQPHQLVSRRVLEDTRSINPGS